MWECVDFLVRNIYNKTIAIGFLVCANIPVDYNNFSYFSREKNKS
jgi:hypothetical protein